MIVKGGFVHVAFALIKRITIAVKSHFQSSACYDLLLRKIQQSLLHPLQQLRMVHRTYTLYILHIIYIRFPLVKY